MALDDEHKEAAFELGSVMAEAMAEEVWQAFKGSVAYELAHRLVDEATDRAWDRLEDRLKQIEEIRLGAKLDLEELIERWFVGDSIMIADALAARITPHLEAVDNEAVKRAVKKIWGPGSSEDA